MTPTVTCLINTLRMRLFYDDDLECVFKHLTATTCCAVACVNKTWNNVALPIIVDKKKRQIEELFPSLNKLLYSCHTWKVCDDLIKTVYNDKRDSCIAFHHSDFLVSGTWKQDRIDIDCVTLCEVEFIEKLMKQDLVFSNLKQVNMTANGTNCDINITTTWENEYLKVVMNGYSPVHANNNVKKGEEFDIKYHINWEKVQILL